MTIRRRPLTRCIGRAGLDCLQFLYDRPERAGDRPIVGTQLLRTSDDRRHHFEYRDNSPVVSIVFSTFGFASRSPRLKVNHVVRHCSLVLIAPASVFAASMLPI